MKGAHVAAEGLARNSRALNILDPIGGPVIHSLGLECV